MLADTKIDWSVRAIEKRFDAAQGYEPISTLKMIDIRCSSNIFNTMIDNLTNRASFDGIQELHLEKLPSDNNFFIDVNIIDRLGSKTQLQKLTICNIDKMNQERISLR